MSTENESRRGALKIIGAIGATCAFPFSADELYGQAEQHAGHRFVQVQQAAPAATRYFSEADWKTVSRLSDLIIPATDTPGAVAAGVPAYIDLVVGRSDVHKEAFRTGLAWLQTAAKEKYGREFLSLSEEQQIALLQPLSDANDQDKISSPGERFFAAVKNLTADGYFTSKIGLMDELGYKGNAVMSEFPGCTHEH